MYQICVSGAAKGKSVKQGRELAHEAGKSIAKAGHVLLTGATSGLPDHAAHSAKKAGGKSVGLSPAASKLEHVKKYHLPTGCYDIILYTGLHYIGRDTLLISSADAIISIGGRIGTLHEFTIAMEMNKPIGFLQGGGGISTEIKDILKAAGREDDENVIFGDNADELVVKLIEILDKRNGDDKEIFEASMVCEFCTIEVKES